MRKKKKKKKKKKEKTTYIKKKTYINGKITKLTWKKKKTRSNGKTTNSLYFFKRWLQWDNKVPTRRRRRHPKKGKYPKDTISNANNVRPKALELLVNTFCYFPYLLISLLRLKTQYFTR